jgi:hypothetical protein
MKINVKSFDDIKVIRLTINLIINYCYNISLVFMIKLLSLCFFSSNCLDII